MEKDGACKMNRQNKKYSCARNNGRRKNNKDKEEEKKLAMPLVKKELPAEGCSRTAMAIRSKLLSEQPARDRAEHGALRKAVRLKSVLVRVNTEQLHIYNYTTRQI